MADVKITDLVDLTDPANNDVLPLVDVSGDVTRKVQIANLVRNANNGSVTAPSFSFDGDSNTGFYRPAANEIGFTTGGGERLRIKSDGKVAIGTSSPQALLHLQKDSAHEILLARTGSAPSEVKFSNSGNLATISNNTNGISFDTGTTPTQRVRIDSSGNVGIGTGGPSSLLHLASNAPYITFEDKDNNQDWQLQATAWFALRNQTTSSELLRIAANGNVGIGTSTPLEKLHVQTGSSGVSSAIGGVDGVIIESGAGRTGGLIFYSPNDRASAILFGDTDSQNIAFYKYNHAENATSIASNGSERLRIDSSGFVGIGTTTAAGRLHSRADGNSIKSLLVLQNRDTGANAAGAISFVNGGLDFSDNRYSYIRSLVTGAGQNGNHLTFGTNANGGGPEERMRISSTGNVGIGTSSPDANLKIYANNSNTPASAFAIRQDNAAETEATTFSIEVSPNDGVSRLISNATTSPQLGFYTGGNERMRIDSSGRLLVGTSTSAAYGAAGLLQILGSTNAHASIARSTDNNAEPTFNLAKSRGTVGAPTIVTSGDSLGRINFVGYDGADFESIGAWIKGEVDGTPGTNDMPTRLVFATASDGASSPTERMRINSSGVVAVNSGFITLNGNKLGAIRITIADDAFATITPPRVGAGYITVIEGGDETFPASSCHGFVYADWGNSTVVNTVNTGSTFETNTGGPPDGTTGNDGHATLFLGGTSGLVYLENRLGPGSSVFFINFI